MRLDQIDHILRAAGDVTGKRHFVLIGSAAVIAWEGMVPELLAMTPDVDLFAFEADEADTEIELEAALGQDSQFHQTHGFYCDGVGPETAVFPQGWESRARLYSSAATMGVTATVPDPNDVALAKLVAWREKDIEWLVAAVRNRIVDVGVMRSRL